MVHSRKLNRHVRLITVLTIAIIAIIVIIVGASFIIGNKITGSPAAGCEYETDSQQVIFTITGPDCESVGQWIANKTGKLWTSTTLTPSGTLMEEDVKGQDTLRLYAAQQPGPIHLSLLLASDLTDAGWTPANSGPSTTPAPTA